MHSTNVKKKMEIPLEAVHSVGLDYSEGDNLQ
jgi:hypothetical protein